CFALLDWSCDPLFSPTLPMGVFLLVPNILLVHPFLFLHKVKPASSAAEAKARLRRKPPVRSRFAARLSRYV
ncbi:unnamed protein product, partial [Closterium sp. NIES-53]